MTISSPVQLCNLTLVTLGNYGSVNNIVTGTTDKEIIFKLIYDPCRQTLLKVTKPNFAIKRKKLPRYVETTVEENQRFGYKYVYLKPANVLTILGIGDIDSGEDSYTIEDNKIFTDYDYPDGLPVRCIVDVTDVSAMSSDFQLLLADYMAIRSCYAITQDAQKSELLKKELIKNNSILGALNAQENKPIRRSHSAYRRARWSGWPGTLNTQSKK